MKRGTKIALWIAAGCIFIGGVLIGIGSVAGGQEQLKEINDNSMGVSFEVAGISISGLDDLLETSGTYRGEDETKGQEILNGDFTRNFSAEGLRELDIAVGVHSLTVMEDEDAEAVVVTGENCDRIQCFVQDGELVLKDVGKEKSNIDLDGRRIMMVVPKGIAWQDADIEAAMASVTIDRLAALEAELNAGMGNVEIGHLDAEKLNIEADMGSVIIKDFSAEKVDISADMGAVEMEGSLMQSLEAEANMGSVKIELEQQKSDFNYNIETSMGSVMLDGESYSRLDQEMFINNMAQGSMELDASMGSIEISFK